MRLEHKKREEKGGVEQQRETQEKKIREEGLRSLRILTALVSKKIFFRTESIPPSE